MNATAWFACFTQLLCKRAADALSATKFWNHSQHAMAMPTTAPQFAGAVPTPAYLCPDQQMTLNKQP